MGLVLCLYGWWLWLQSQLLSGWAHWVRANVTFAKRCWPLQGHWPGMAGAGGQIKCTMWVGDTKGVYCVWGHKGGPWWPSDRQGSWVIPPHHTPSVTLRPTEAVSHDCPPELWLSLSTFLQLSLAFCWWFLSVIILRITGLASRWDQLTWPWFSPLCDHCFFLTALRVRMDVT